jgi:23S rRNA (guanine745-N1)-methyltransferase
VLDDVVGWLRCPHCGGRLARADGSLRCAAKHTFDIARQGYVSLLQPGASGGAGDTAEMVRARNAFLATGHFAPIAAALADAAAPVAIATATPDGGPAPDAAGASPPAEPCRVVGAGTGYYLAVVLDRVAEAAGLALACPSTRCARLRGRIR